MSRVSPDQHRCQPTQPLAETWTSAHLERSRIANTAVEMQSALRAIRLTFNHGRSVRREFQVSWTSRVSRPGPERAVRRTGKGRGTSPARAAGDTVGPAVRGRFQRGA